MLPYRSNRLVGIVLILFFIGVLGYGYFEARHILYGPIIEIATPNAPLSVSEPLVHIRGAAKNITVMRMNGNPIVVTEDGAFDEALLLAPGYNKVVLSASDKLGRTTLKVLEIIYSGEEIGARASTSPSITP